MSTERRRVDVTVVLHTWEDVPAEWSDEDVRFYIEENHCKDNYVQRLAKEIEADQSHCHTCCKGARAYVGKVTLVPGGPSENDT